MKKYLYPLFAMFLGLLGLVSCSEETEENLEQYYTVTFNSMGGSEVESQEVKAGELAVKPGNPSKDGEVFISWFTSDKFDHEWNFEKDVVNTDVTLFAKWSKPDEVCIVTFESNGGSKVDSKNVEKGGKLSVLPEPTKEGFVFEGWYKDADFKTKFELSETINNNMTLYAKWDAESEDSLKKMLKEKIAEAEGLKAEDYSESSYKLMQNALKEAKDIYEKTDATKEELQKAYDSLNAAVNGLYLPLEGKPDKLVFNNWFNPNLWENKYLVVNQNWNAPLYINFEILDKCGNSCYGYDLKFDFNEEQLKKWTNDNNIQYYESGIIINLKQNLTIGDEVEITASLKENPSISTKVILKVYERSWINNKYIETVNKFPNVDQPTFDNFLSLQDILKEAELLEYSGVLKEDMEKETEVKAAKEKMNKFEYILDDDYENGFWDSPFIKIDNENYIVEFSLSKYTIKGNKFPLGTFEFEAYNIGEPGVDIYFQEKIVFEEKEYKLFYREITNSLVGEWEPELRCEYKYIEGKDGNGTLITHVVEDYLEPGTRSALMSYKRSMHKMLRK